eukprot:TRINITY_DN10047_c0_g1_i7.p1 TRINITY_DN10047_c0_g1~~TRINITY_DN10047_c0_g1_i7.p1  ORF type:complete len:892 (+),score=267.63 TRINITY_DN10047_c0_g1_i7:330-2678(+)
MDKLAKSMQATQELSETIDTKLQPRRERITRLASGHLMLKKLQFLFELPARLRQCLEMKLYDQAVKYYAKAKNVLWSYREMESFKGIYSECSEIAQELEAVLVAKVDDPSLSQRELTETMSLLLRLTGDGATLATKLLARAKLQWQSDMQAADDVYETFVAPEPTESSAETEPSADQAEAGIQPEDNPSNDEPADRSQQDGDAPGASSAESEEDVTRSDKADDRTNVASSNADKSRSADAHDNADNADNMDNADTDVKDVKDAKTDSAAKSDPRSEPTHRLLAYAVCLRKKVLPHLAEWIICFQNSFLGGEESTGHDEDDDSQPSSPSKQAEARKQQHRACKHLLIEFCQTHVQGELLARIDALLRTELEQGTPLSILNQFLDRCIKSAARLHKIVPAADLEQHCAELAVTFVKLVSRDKAKQLLKSATELLSNQADADNSQLSADAIRQQCQQLLSTVTTQLDDLATVTATSYSRTHAFFNVKLPQRTVRVSIVRQYLYAVQVQLSTVLPQCHETSEDLAKVDNDQPADEVSVYQYLKHASLAFALGEHLVAPLYGHVAKLFPLQQGKHDTSTLDDLSIKEQAANYRAIGQQCITTGARAAGTQLSVLAMLHLRNRDWWSISEPQDGTSESFQAIMTRLSELQDLALAVWPNARPKGSLSSFARKVQTDVVSSVLKLFTDTIPIFTNVSNSIDSFSSAMVLPLLKGLAEGVRSTRLSTAALQQLQVDLAALHRALGQYVYNDESENHVNTLLAQAMTNAIQRCEDGPQGLLSPEQVQERLP